MKINTTSLTIATILTVLFIVVMTVAGELAPAFKVLLIKFAGHHWVAEGILALLFYAVAYFLFSRVGESAYVARNALLVLVSVVWGGIVISGFFLLHFLNILTF